MPDNVFAGSVHVNGPLTVGSGGLIPSSGCISDSHVAGGANIDADKLQAKLRKGYAQESDTTAASEKRVIHVATAAGSLIAFEAGCVIANIGAATVTFDLRKNGTTVLSVTAVVSSAHAARQLVAGTISVIPYVDGDVFEVYITATAGGGTLGKGAFCQAVFDENPL